VRIDHVSLLVADAIDLRRDGVRRAFLRDPDGHVVEAMQAPG
jgi:catechol 2,3-dioxygenase-like lactoylglutathione lyase family enzyme